MPLFCLTEGARWLLLHAFSTRSSSRRAHGRSFSYCRWSALLYNSGICLAYSSCFVSISRNQQMNWSSRDWFSGLLAIAIGSDKWDELAGTTKSSGCEGSIDSRRSLARYRCDFLLGRSHRRRQLWSLIFSESIDRRAMNLAAKTCKINKVPAVVCRSALQCLS